MFTTRFEPAIYAAAAAAAAAAQLEVRQLSSAEVCFKGSVGGTVNNALHIAKHSNGESSRMPLRTCAICLAQAGQLACRGWERPCQQLVPGCMNRCAVQQGNDGIKLSEFNS
jgi:hypothetical protein